VLPYRLEGAKYCFSNRLAGLKGWNDVREEAIDSKILVGLKKKTDICLNYNRGDVFFLAYRLMHGFTFKFNIRTTRNREVSTR